MSVCIICELHAIFIDHKLLSGKDFDFSSRALPEDDFPPSHSARLIPGSSSVHGDLQASLSVPSNLCMFNTQELGSSSDIFQS